MDSALSPVATRVDSRKVNSSASALESGAPGETRTPGLLVRSQMKKLHSVCYQMFKGEFVGVFWHYLAAAGGFYS